VSETANRICWNTYWYLTQLECHFIPGPTDGGTEFNITSSLVRGRLRQAPRTADPSSAMKQQPQRNCKVTYSRNSRLFCLVVHGEKHCARDSWLTTIFVTWSSTSWWRFSVTTRSGVFPNCDPKVQNCPNGKQTWKIGTSPECRPASYCDGTLASKYHGTVGNRKF